MRTRPTIIPVLIVAIACAAGADAALVYEYDADNNPGHSGGAWDSTTANQDRNWAIGPGISLASVTGSATSFSNAYSFAGTGDTMTQSEYNLGADYAIEAWFRIDELPGSTAQTLFESGGEFRGAALFLRDGQVHYQSTHGNDDPEVVSAAADLTTAMIGDFVQVVVAVDSSGAGETRLYLNGGSTPADTAADITNPAPWGADDAGMGGVNSQIANGDNDDNGGSFDGQIALLRLYDAALDGEDVGASFATIVPEPASAALVMAGAVCCLGRGRRRRDPKMYDVDP